LPLLRPLGFGDVTGDFRGGDDFSSLVLDRRNGQGNIDKAPVLALSNRLVVIDFFASANPFEDKGFFVLSIHWNKDRHRPSHGLPRCIAKEELRAPVPSHNDAVEILGKDRVVRRFDDGRIVLSGAIASQSLWESDRPECSCDNLQSSGIGPRVPDAQAVRPESTIWNESAASPYRCLWRLLSRGGQKPAARQHKLSSRHRLAQKNTFWDSTAVVVRVSGRIDHRNLWVQFPDSFRDIPAGRTIGEANVGDKNIEGLGLLKPLERVGSRGGLQHRPSFLPEPARDVLTDEPIILDNQDS